MNFIIEYFLKNSRLNYTILLFILVMGIFAYIKIPKEMFPTVELESITITGSYNGASAESLNNFAVTEIENQIESISGIDSVTSTITSGTFKIDIELQDGVKAQEKLNDVKDAVSTAKKYFPSDMTEPTVSAATRQMSLLNVSLTSPTLDKKDLLKLSDKLKSDLMQIDNVSEVKIFGDTDLQIDIQLDHKKINMYGLNSSTVVSAISELSYMYPVANIEQVGNHIYLSADNNKFNINFWKNSIIKSGEKKVYLNDISTITIDYPIDETISRLNGENTLTLSIYKDENGDSISIASKVRELFSKYEKSNKDISLIISRDSSEPVNDRIKTITANITLGLILVGFSMYILISPRLSFVIILGIPFSFIIGLMFIEMMGYSLNMISMMAMLITLGIVVDDAIIVSENIQRYLDEGYDLKTAVLDGTKEMIAPVLIAAMTTVFAFLPMLLISGEMGLLMKLIPIVITALIIASLIESFLFLPLHAKHILKPNDKQLDWSKTYDLYEKILHKIIHNKKLFLVTFFITIPILSYVLVTNSRFQFMPDMDSNNITASIKLNESMAIEQTNEIAKKYEKILIDNSKELFIKNVNTTVGSYQDITNELETTENGFTLAIELQDFKEDNFLENYINPILNLSFDFERADKIRTITTNDAMNKIRALITPLTKEDKATDLNIVTKRIGIIRTDIEIMLSASDTQKLITTIDKIKNELAKIQGVKDITDNTKLGNNEYKYVINAYGKTLGLTDSQIASAINSFFMEKEQANTFNQDGIIKIITESSYKNNLKELENFYIPLDNDKYIRLQDVVDFKIERNFEKIEKENGQIYKKVFANVENKIINATEVLEKLTPIIKEIRDDGIIVEFGGEREKTQALENDLLKAFLIALFLIFITLLINFPSFKSAFMIISVIPFTIMGPIIGHFVVGINLSSQSMIGMLGLAGVVINDGIIMLDFLKDTNSRKEFYERAKQRVRPIIITSLTTMLGLFTLMFFPTGESVMLQPIAISLGFGILWGTVLNLIYIPALYATVHKINE